MPVLSAIDSRAMAAKNGKRAWIIKSEPSVYPWEQLVEDGRTLWDGVRNYAARNHLRAMQRGDWLLFYHSNEGKELVGVAKVVREAYADPTSEDDWSVVDVAPVKPLKTKVTLAAIKAEPRLAQMPLVRQGRLSVSPVNDDELACLLELAKTKL